MLNLKNSFIMAPLKLGYSDGTGAVTDRHLSFYAARSKYLGAVAPEPLYMDKGLREIPTQLGIDNDDKIKGLKKLTDIIHASNTKVIAHLNHPGRMANPKIPGNFHLSSSDKPCENGGATPKRMNDDDIADAVKLFADSAKRAEKAGFDIIELQFGHGYLAAQFLSPAVNDRDDNYGGSFENRIRFSVEVLEAVKQAADLPVIARISGDEMTENGYHLDETIKFVSVLKDNGVEAVHVSAGTVCSTPPWFFQHMFVPKGKTWEFAKKIKESTGMPVISVGRVHSSEDIDLLLNEYKSDYVAIGRALVADPYFAGKYLGEIDDYVRPCMACSEGCLGGVRGGTGLGCVVNPVVSFENKSVQKAGTKKNIAVIGGGLAGMEAAITLSERGHNVRIYEKEKLGGQFNLAWLPPKKESLKEIVDYYENEIDKMGISVSITDFNADDLDEGIDAVVIATGAVPAVPPIKGLKDYYWADYLLDENLPQNEKILIIGGGLIGIEMASKLIDRKNEVIVVEMLSEIARGMEMIEKKMTLAKLKAGNTQILLDYKVTEIDGDKVMISGAEDKVLDGIDKIIVTAGMKSLNELEEKLKDKVDVYVIGDAHQVGKAQEAIKDAYETALRI